MIDLVSDTGKGRSFVILQESFENSVLNQELSKSLSEKSRVLIIQTPIISETNWRQISDSIIYKLDELKIRQASFIGRDSVTAVIQNIGLAAIRLVRTMVLINPATRAHPSFFINVLDWIDRHLPMGVPFASKGKAFDGKSYLQRLRCPVLIITNDKASYHQLSESEIMSERIPTAWLIREDQEDKVKDLIVEFQEVPAKCPQKNLKQCA